MKIGVTDAAATVLTLGPTSASPSMPATASQPMLRNRRPVLRVFLVFIDITPPSGRTGAMSPRLRWTDVLPDSLTILPHRTSAV